MASVKDYGEGCLLVVVPIVLLGAIFVGVAILLAFLIRDLTAASLAATTFMIGIATPFFNGVICLWLRLAKNYQIVPLEPDKRKAASIKIRLYLLKSSAFISIIVGVVAFGPPMPDMEVKNPAFAGGLSLIFGALGVALGYRSLKWMLHETIAPADCNNEAADAR